MESLEMSVALPLHIGAEYRLILHMQILNEFEVANFGFVGKLGGLRRFFSYEI